MIPRTLRSSAGLTYIAALVMVVIFGIMAAQGAQFWSTRMQREREVELIYKGTQVRDAMRRMYGLTLRPNGSALPPGTPQPVPALVIKIPANAPKLNTIEDLVQAPDSAGKKHYMRPSNKKVKDPATGKEVDWEFFKDPTSQRVTGVFIKSEGLPIKQDFSDHPDLHPDDFKEKKKYNDWVFICDRYPQPVVAGGSQQGANGTGQSSGSPSTDSKKP